MRHLLWIGDATLTGARSDVKPFAARAERSRASAFESRKSNRSDPSVPPRTDEHPGEGAVRGTQRMEIFADAVFAIAFTLPMIELQLPEAGPDFASDLLGLWPEFLAYGLSALVIGIYWVHHHFSGAIYRTTGHHFLLATLLFLVAIGFIAFPTRGFAENIEDPVTRGPAAIFYACALAVTSAAWLLKWRVGCLTDNVDDRLDQAYVDRLTRKYRWTTLVMVAGAAIAFWRWEVGLALSLLVTLTYLHAPETPVYVGEAPPVEGEG